MRIEYASAHNGFAIESVPVGFTGIKKILGGKFERLSAIRKSLRPSPLTA